MAHIPADCKYLCQPVDVTINQSINSGMQEKWEDLMIGGDGFVNGAAQKQF